MIWLGRSRHKSDQQVYISSINIYIETEPLVPINRHFLREKMKYFSKQKLVKMVLQDILVTMIVSYSGLVYALTTVNR